MWADTAEIRTPLGCSCTWPCLPQHPSPPTPKSSALFLPPGWAERAPGTSVTAAPDQRTCGGRRGGGSPPWVSLLPGGCNSAHPQPLPPAHSWVDHSSRVSRVQWRVGVSVPVSRSPLPSHCGRLDERCACRSKARRKAYPDLKLRAQKKPTQADWRWNSPLCSRVGSLP